MLLGDYFDKEHILAIFSPSFWADYVRNYFSRQLFPTDIQIFLFPCKDCVRYIFASLFFKSKGEHLGNKGKCFFTSKALFVLEKIKF